MQSLEHLKFVYRQRRAQRCGSGVWIWPPLVFT